MKVASFEIRVDRRRVDCCREGEDKRVFGCYQASGFHTERATHLRHHHVPNSESDFAVIGIKNPLSRAKTG